MRDVFVTFEPILAWRLIGPFPADGKVCPPEKERKFDAVYESDGRKVRWREQQGDPKQYGKVNLAPFFSPNNNVVAYGYAEVEAKAARDAQLLVGSDDTLVVWVNGKKVYEVGGSRAWAHGQAQVNIRLEKGTNAILIRCGNVGGPWEFSVAVSSDPERYAFLQGGAPKLGLEAYRAFVRRKPGDAKRGEQLFRDLKGLACVKCHAVGGEGGQVGPDLAGVGLKYTREDLVTSVLEPSKVIAQGYETIVVTTSKGQTLTGVFKGESADAVSLADAEGKLHHIPKKDIEERAFSPVSTMPNGLNEGMSPQDFADLVAYLEARREDRVPPRKGGTP